MKNLLSTLFLAGTFFLNSCDEQIKKENKLEENPLEIDNEPNVQIYKDFIEFYNEKIKKEMPRYAFVDESLFFADSINKDLSVLVTNNSITLQIKGREFYDSQSDGLDSYYDSEDIKLFRDLSPEKQLSLSKEYTNTLKQIMRDEKYKNY